MEQLIVSVEQDHLERLVKSPIIGVAELVWNGLDADASTVAVELTTNTLGGIESVTITDDGTGITLHQVQKYFSHLGGSWKKLATQTDGGRLLHGRNGQGRWTAYGIGEQVQWMTVADDIQGQRNYIEITGRRSALREFQVGSPIPVTDSSTGTRVLITNLTEAAQKTLLRDSTVDELTTVLALYLKQYPVKVLWQGNPLDPARLQSSLHQAELDVAGLTGITLTVIEWRQPVKRAMHLCDTSGTSLFQLPPGIQAPGFEFTAYITWKGFRDSIADLALAELGQEPLASIVDAAKDELKRHFKERADERGSILLKSWKDEHSYPFKDEPRTIIERAERNLFDLVAVAAAPAVETADTRYRKLSLRLLREALEKSPRSVHDVLREVLDLPPERLTELTQLIERTSLSAIITAARRITDRLDFLTGLEEIVFDRELKKHFLERSQLHRILAAETWVFREEYALTADDVTLKTALRDHIQLLGRDELTPAEVDAAEVLDEDGRKVVVDMMLSRVVEQRRNHREHIVIELKRPNVHVGMDQFSQIQNYATAVTMDSRFARIDCRWEFWIVGDMLKPAVEKMANQKGRDPGIVVEGESFVVRAVTWAEVIQDARHRLAFVRQALDYQSTNDTGIQYLQRAHSQHLPDLIVSPAVPAPRAEVSNELSNESMTDGPPLER
ncbi:ATP-binding protein [Nonomuraea sp. NPDC059023]|uniref:ATP-binding protein n=1 Tax=unclassified Nonomuraea TaxID=2593643 RepID=UPI0036881B3A